MPIAPKVATSRPADEQPLLSHLWWLPLVFVVASLLVLTVVPIVVDQRVRSVRNGAVAASDRARVLVNDLEAAFATEMLQPDSSEVARTSLRDAMAVVAADADSLAVAVREVDPEAADRFSRLRPQLAEWAAAGLNSTTAPGALSRARGILATADSLDLHLERFSDQQRASVRRLEQFDVASALILAPLAFIAIGVVIWGGQRVLHLARVAERERSEVIRSTQARAALLRGVNGDAWASSVSSPSASATAAPRKPAVGMRIRRTT